MALSQIFFILPSFLPWVPSGAFIPNFSVLSQHCSWEAELGTVCEWPNVWCPCLCPSCPVQVTECGSWLGWNAWMHSSSSRSFSSSAPLQEDGQSQHHQRHHPQADQGACEPRWCWVERGGVGAGLGKSPGVAFPWEEISVTYILISPVRSLGEQTHRTCRCP